MKKFDVKAFLKSFVIWFLVFYGIMATYNYFWGEKNNNPVIEKQEIVLSAVKDEVVIGNLAQFEIYNKLDKKISFASPCDTPGSVKIFRLMNDQRFEISKDAFSNCNGKTVESFDLEPGVARAFAMKDFNMDLFKEEGKYEVEFSFSSDEETITVSAPIEFERPGMFRQLFRAIVSKPLFNILVFLTKVLPGHSFGWAIVIMTLIVRICLFLPNQKSMKSQRELQKLQPKLEEIKRQHGKNQQMVAMKTMELYKSHKINPMSSCLPMLLQMPFLIGIYYIVRDGLSPHLSYLLYSFQQGVDLTVGSTDFYGLDLEINGPIYLAVIVGLAQFGAVKLSLISAKKKAKKAAEGKDVSTPTAPPGQMQQMNKIMLWVMPVMIGWFTTSFPAGVGVYWLTSTIFGIFQQKLVNWQLDKPQVTRKES